MTHLRRPCKKCDDMYTPIGRYNTICDTCQKISEVNKGIRMWIKRGEDTLKKNHKELIHPKNTDLKKELKHLNKTIKKYIK